MLLPGISGNYLELKTKLNYVSRWFMLLKKVKTFNHNNHIKHLIYLNIPYFGW
jgi:hypothetical protein